MVGVAEAVGVGVLVVPAVAGIQAGPAAEGVVGSYGDVVDIVFPVVEGALVGLAGIGAGQAGIYPVRPVVPPGLCSFRNDC